MDAALQNHLKGSLMRAGFHDTAKVTGPPSFRREVVSNCVVAGMRSGFVVRPYCAPQIIERPEAAVPAHNDIGVINRPATIALMPHHRGRQQLNGCLVVVLPDVRQTTNPADVDFAPVEQSFPFLPRNSVDEFSGNTEGFAQ